MTDQDRARLHGCDGVLVARIDRILQAMAALGFPMLVGPDGGFRTVERQQEIFARGRTTPGLKVTNADGVTTKSHHQSGRAVDCVFQDAHGNPSWDSRYPWATYGACGEALGLKWGGRWTIHDLPHLELPEPPAGVPV